MEIEIKKGDYSRKVDVDVNALPALSLKNVFVIGFRNLPAVTDFDVSGDAIVARVPMADLAKAGLTNILNDAHASVKADDANAQALTDSAVDKKLAALVNGTVRVASGGRTADPIAKRATLIARPYAIEKLKKAGIAKPEEKQILAKAKELVASNPAYRTLAIGQLDQEKALRAALGETEPEAETDETEEEETPEA